jgi:hypothetical protein
MLKSEQKSSEKAGDMEIFLRVRELVIHDVPVTKACERHNFDRNRYYYLLRQSEHSAPQTKEAS